MILKMLEKHHLAVMEAKSASELRDEIVRFTKKMEFETVSAMVVVDNSLTHSSFYCVGNIPEEYLHLWEDDGLMKIDPVMQHAKRSSIPIVWDQNTYASHGLGGVWEEQAAFGFKTGVALSLHLPGDLHFFIGVDRDKPLTRNARALTQVVAEIQLFAVHAHEAALKHLVPLSATVSDNSPPRLTNRELEALRWTMDGKLAREIADILNISERTAVFHLQNATRKLGCRSKFQAVLRAIDQGLLQ